MQGVQGNTATSFFEPSKKPSYIDPQNRSNPKLLNPQTPQPLNP